MTTALTPHILRQKTIKHRGKYLRWATCKKVKAILREAFKEDDREGGSFDPIGFDQFCPEEKPEHVREAWRLYEDYHLEHPQVYMFDRRKNDEDLS